MRILPAQGALAVALLIASVAGAAGQAAFSHSAHEGLFPLCEGCHPVGPEGVTAYPDPASCATCHDGEELSRVTWEAPASRETLDHRFHPAVAESEPLCGSCHARLDRIGAVAAVEACAECHDRHHEAGDVRCRACHGEASVPEHPVEAHLGCAGSECHQPDRFAATSFDRELCLVCHQDMVDHRPGRACGPCHAVGDPRP